MSATLNKTTNEQNNGTWCALPTDDAWQRGEDSYPVAEQILGTRFLNDPVIPLAWTRHCARRVRRLRDVLRKSWIGLETEWGGHLTDILLAACIARENAVLIGPPGGAKTDIAVRMFELLGLKEPGRPDDPKLPPPETLDDAWTIWSERSRLARKQQSFFRALLTRFTQPDEIFGPWEISLLRQGVLARVNFGMMTGPGVRAAFVDEIFKASANLLNTLLTVVLERRYFQWNAWRPADLAFLVAASNEMPVAYGGSGPGDQDFRSQHALVDRFCVRLPVPVASGGTHDDPTQTDLAQAFDVAWQREAMKFSHGHAFRTEASVPRTDAVTEQQLSPPRPDGMPCINDLLLLGRACLQHQATGSDVLTTAEGEEVRPLFRDRDLKKFRDAFLRTAAALQADGTDIESGRITWTISPRKLRQLYKIALIHAVICDDEWTNNSRQQVVAPPGEKQLHVFDFIWDSPAVAGQLLDETDALTGQFY